MPQQRTLKIIVVFLWIIQSIDSAAQNSSVLSHYSFVQKNDRYFSTGIKSFDIIPQTGKILPKRFFLTQPSYADLSSRFMAVQPGFYCSNTGLICRKEWAFEKATKLPLRLRLGSLEYVNWLEQKPNSAIHH